MKKGWHEARLGDILERSETINPQASPNSIITYIDVSSVSNTTFTIGDTQTLKGKDAPSRARKLVRTNDVIFATIRPTLQRIAIIPEYLNMQVCSTGFIVLRPQSNFDSRFMFYYLCSEGFTKSIEALQKGASYPAVTDEDVRNQAIQIPSLPEQKRIVKILDEAFAGIATAKANAEKNLENAKALFESYLNSAVQGLLHTHNASDDRPQVLLQEICRIRAEKQKRKSSAKDTGSGISALQFDIPANWDVAHLEQLSFSISDGVHKKPDYKKSGIPFITIRNLTAGEGISFDEVSYISPNDHKEFTKRTNPEKGDILITKDGTIGVVRVIETDTVFSIFVSVALIKPVVKTIAKYLSYALQASCIQEQIKPKGAALKHLYLEDLRKLLIPIPPLNEQDRIVEKIEELKVETDSLYKTYLNKVSELKALKKSILNEAFSGNL